MAGGRGDPPKPITGTDDNDWANALDEWDAQLDDAFNVVENPTQEALVPEEMLTEVSLKALPREMEPAPLPLDEPPPLDAAAMDFGADLVTAQQEAIATLPGGDDPLRGLFEGEAPSYGEPTTDAMEPIGEMLPTMRSAPTLDEHSVPTRVSAALPPVDDPPAEDTTRVFGTAELAPLLADERGAAHDDGEDEHLEISLEGALEAAAEVTEAITPVPVAVDEEFYDTIAIEPGAEEQSVPRPAPKQSEPLEEDEEEILVAARDAGDPDLTPLPVDSDEPGFTPALRVPIAADAPRPSQTALLPLRPPRPAAEPATLVGVTGAPLTLDEKARRELLSLLDTERLLADKTRIAALAFDAARLSHALGDAQSEAERVDAALRAHANHPGALAMARRAALALRDLPLVEELLARERGAAAPREREGLTELSAAIADSRGLPDEARRLDAETDLEGDEAAGARLAAVAFGKDRATTLTAARSAFSAATDPRFAAAVELAVARVGGDSGDRYRAALTVEGRSTHAALGLWRQALTSNDRAAEREALERLDEALPPSPLRAATDRRVASLELAAGEAAGHNRLLTAADGGDDLAALFLAHDPTPRPATDEEVARLSRVVTILADAGQRAAVRFELGRVEEARGRTAAAISAYADAERDMPAERRAVRALQRARSLGGDKQAALERHLRVAATDEGRASFAFTRAGALLLDLGRAGEALQKLDEALKRQPDDAEALASSVVAALSHGTPAHAAELLVAGAEATEDVAYGASLRARAATLYAQAGQVQRAFDLLATDASPVELADFARRLAFVEPQRVHQLLGDFAALAETQSQAPAAARMYAERATLASDSTQAIEDLRRALSLHPSLRGASALAVRRLRPRDAGAAAELLLERHTATPSEQRAAADVLEVALAVAEDADDVGAAVALLGEAGSSEPSVVAERTRLARLRGSDPGLSSAYEQAVKEIDAPERVAALRYSYARALERGGYSDEAVKQLRQAHEALPAARSYRDALERMLERASDTALLTELALSDLREANDTRSKVAAYGRLAFIDESLRGDVASARMSYDSIAELDRSAQDAARRLERALMSERRFADLVDLYDRLALLVQDPSAAVAIILERSRLRQRIGGELGPNELAAAVDNDLRLALFQNPRANDASKTAYARAGERKDAPARYELALRLAELAHVAKDTRTSAVYLVRGAHTALRLERLDDARAHLREALVRSPGLLPAWVMLFALSVRQDDMAGAAEAAEAMQRVLRDTAARRESGLVAAALYERVLADPVRAIAALRAVLEADPQAELAVARLRALLTAREDWPAVVELLESRIRLETDGHRLVALHVELARLHRDRVGDLTRARAELAAALGQDGAAADALALLADIEEAEGKYAAAAELLLRRAKLERARPELGKLLLRLGGLYAQHLDDPKRAIQCLSRVLQIDQNHREAIELLAEAYGREWDWANALGALRHLTALETDTHKKSVLIHRAARIEEEGLKQPREALALYRAALQLEPTNLDAVEALGQFFDRQSDTQSLRVLCDTTARRLRQGLAGGPRDADAFRALGRVFALRHAPDRMAIVAGALEWMGSIEPEEKRALERLRTREQYPGSALADAALDEMLFDARAPAGFRNLMRLVEDSLMKTFRTDVKQLGLGRGDRLPRSGHAVRDIANRIAADLDVREFEIYVSPSLGNKATLEIADPLSLCIGSALTEGVHELGLRFLFARFFKMAQLRLAIASRLAPEALAALTAGIVRQFVPEFAPVGLDPAAIGAEAQRVQKLLPRKLATELHTFALECAAPSTHLASLSAGVTAAANRAGLLAIGAPGPALGMLERMGLSSEARELALFCVSDELAELRRMIGTSIG